MSGKEGMIRILFICHGNICRSPMFEFVMRDMVEKRGLQDKFEIESAATSTEELYNPVHSGTQAELRKHNIGGTPYTDFRKKRARQLKRSDYDYYDYLICAESYNIQNAVRITGEDKKKKIKLLLDFTDRRGCDVDDPWYSRRFDETYRDTVEGCKGLLEYLEREGKI